jgi:hypothetical protein
LLARALIVSWTISASAIELTLDEKSNTPESFENTHGSSTHYRKSEGTFAQLAWPNFPAPACLNSQKELVYERSHELELAYCKRVFDDSIVCYARLAHDRTVFASGQTM